MSGADAKAVRVGKGLSHYRYEARVPIETEIDHCAPPISAGRELGAVVGIHIKE